MKRILLTIIIATIPSISFPDNGLGIASNVAAKIATKDTFRERSLGNAKELRAQLKEMQCPGYRYRHYRVDNTVYVIGSRRGGIVIGRNFKYSVDATGNADLASLISSTRGCLALDAGQGIPFATHLGKEPTEFHQIAATIHDTELYISAQGTLWKVSKDSIEEVKRD
jgi:hypothetical protein